jgi:hypothetical protein
LNKNQISMEIDGIIYGAYSDGDPLGGGKQYRDAFTTGNYVATNADELYAAAAAAGFGDVIFIPGGTIIELGNAQSGTLTSLLLKAGVTLASDRGKVNANGTVSIGAIIKTSYNTTKEMITIGGDNVRITGIVVHGADPGRHLAHWDRCFASTGPKLDYSYFYKLPVTKGIHCVYNNLEVDNCEFSGFSYAARSITIISTITKSRLWDTALSIPMPIPPSHITCSITTVTPLREVAYRTAGM